MPYIQKIKSLLRTYRSDLRYLLAERNQLKMFSSDIRSGVQRAEPRFREITDLSVHWPPGTVEYAHLCRYKFALPFIDGRVLNAACGCGFGNAILAETGAYPVGVDLFELPLTMARRNFPIGSYVRADVMRLDAFGTGTFDNVVSFETIEHVADPFKACSEFKRVLKKGGVFVGSLPIMIFHNPGSNFTYRQALRLVRSVFPGASLYLQDNYQIAPHSLSQWRHMRKENEKFLVWTWKKPIRP